LGEGADPRSLLRGDMCVVVLAMCVCVFVPAFVLLDVAPTSPFIVSKERARVTFVVKR
jgi:hypothetical protein